MRISVGRRRANACLGLCRVPSLSQTSMCNPRYVHFCCHAFVNVHQEDWGQERVSVKHSGPNPPPNGRDGPVGCGRSVLAAEKATSAWDLKFVLSKDSSSCLRILLRILDIVP